ncbi:MBL fold metallo-hydrolase [Clostridium sp. SHJSY1]|uniref:MBL fold metallo-hydrolase n=1 Tax=Clostridium sp. SHJSY1 TaxID=2942483 RepID=UPI002875F5E1|nr:MBL fold metallo-hydrolase [Clostridium sp. SHJSY1]MDS0526835.1 MBL fold metallo-hydrolase [Clostridium sp. SHJSY1]
MLIKWFGECSFLLQDSLGRRIITDPPTTIPIENLLDLHPNVITLSHFCSDSLNDIINEKKIQLVNRATSYTFNFSNILGIPSFQDDIKGQKRGPNIIYKYMFDDLKICNLGYLGHELSDNTLHSLGQIDILFIPIGGNFTLNFVKATKLINKLNPKIIIPMYYRTPNSLIYIDSCKNFIISMKSILKIDEYSFDTSSLDSNSFPITIILKESKLNTQ